MLRDFWTNYRAPIVLLALLVLLGVMFHHVLLPFMVAIFLAFLMEPVVSRLSAVGIAGKKLPRGGAVLIVYTIVTAAVVSFSALVVPQLIREVGQLVEATPEFFRELRDERLPALNERIDGLLTRIDLGELSERDVESAQSQVYEALDQAELYSVFYANLSESEALLHDEGRLLVESSNEGDQDDSVLLRVRNEGAGEYAVLLEADQVLITQDDTGALRVARDEPDDEGDFSSSVDLVAAMDDALRGAIETSGKAVTDTLAFGQRLLSHIFEAFLTILVTMMVAAFVSIDVPGIVRFIRSLFPKKDQEAVGELMAELSRGLAGVIRGQIVISFINGVLTFIGLAIFGIKYAFVLAVIAGVLSMIPVFGSIISTIPAVIIALTQSMFAAVGILIWIIVIHFIEGNILNPKIIGSQAEMHPAIIIFALLAGEHTWGLVGAVLAVPVASIVQTLYLFFKDNSAPADDNVQPAVSGVLADNGVGPE